MIDRYDVPEVSAIWSDEARMRNWLEIELAAVEAWAVLGVVPKDDARACRDRASFDVDAVLERERVTRHDVAAFVDVVAASIGPEGRWIHHRPDVLRRVGHRPRDAAACERRRAPRRSRRVARGGAAARARVPRHGVHGSIPRHPRRTDLVRAQARRVRVPVGPGPRAAAPRARRRQRRRDQRGRRHVRERGPAGGAARLRTGGARAGRGVDPGDPARPSRGVRCGAGRLRLHARRVGDRDPSPGAHGGARGAGAVRRRAEGLERDAAQAEPGGERAGERSRARDPRPRGRRRSRTSRCGTSATSRTRRPSGSSSPTRRVCWRSCCAT